MLPVYALRRDARCRCTAPDLPFRLRMSLAVRCERQLALAVAITGIAAKQGLMPGRQAAAVGDAWIASMLLFPASLTSDGKRDGLNAAGRCPTAPTS